MPIEFRKQARRVPAHLGARWMLVLGILVFSIGPAQGQHLMPTPEEVYDAAYTLYQNGFFAQAAQQFADFRTRHPNHPNAPEAMYFEAESILGDGHADQATERYTEFQRTYPLHPLAAQARLALGQYFYHTQDYVRAVETLNEVLADEPEAGLAAKSLYWMGRASLQLGQFEKGIGYFNRAAQSYPDTETAPIALYAIAHAYAEQRQYAEAAQAFESLDARYPRSSTVQHIGLALAEAYYEMGNYERVISEVDRRLNQLDDESRERATFLLAESYNQLRQSKEAIVYYRRFTESSPDSPYYRLALYGLAWNYHFEDAFQWAAEHFERAHRGFSDTLSHRAMYYQGVNLKLAGRPEEAARVFGNVVQNWPNGPLADQAQFELGMSYYGLRRWKEAGEAFQVVLDQYPNSQTTGDALRMKGEASVAQGNFNEAFDAYDSAISLDAAPPELREQVAFQKAWLLYRKDDFSAAAPAFLALYRRNKESDQAGDAVFWAAESYYQAGSKERAIRLFTEFLRTFPDHKHRNAAHYALGWAFFNQNRYASAAEQFQQFLRRYNPDNEIVPYGDDARLRLADSYYALKQYQLAVAAYRNVGGDDADYALYRIGQSLSLDLKSTEAIDSFNTFLERFPDSQWREEAMYAKGYLWFLEQGYDRAITDYGQLVERFPKDPLAAKAQYGIADAHYNMGRLEEALAAYQLVLDRHPESPLVVDAYSGMQYALLSLEREEEMEGIIDAFAQQHPNSPMVDELRFRHAEVQYQNGDLAGAVNAFHGYIRSAPNSARLADAYFYLGSAYADLEQHEDAEVYLSRLIEAFPLSNVRLLGEARLGRIYLAQNRHREALSLYRRLGQAAGNNVSALAEAQYGEGMALLGVGRVAEAEALLQNIVSDSSVETPEGLPARLGLARVYEQQQKFQEAMDLYRQVADRGLDEVAAESLYRLGKLLTDQSNPAGALEELGRMPVLFASYPDWVARGYLEQGRAYQSLGQNGDAVRMYDLVITGHPGTSFYNEAVRLKEALQ